MVLRAAPVFRRRGAVAPFAAFLLVVLIGMVAFVVDVGWIVLARTELQSAADAAALAGADALMDGYVQYQTAGLNASSTSNQATILSTAMSNARTKAENFASYNGAGGVNSLTLNDGDVEFGYTNSSGNYTAYSSGQPFPNTVKVTLRMDSSANGSLGLFFAPAIGTKSTDLKATAAAVLMGGKINSFSSPGTQSIGMLPMTYDVNRWASFVSTGQQPDGTTSLSTYNSLPQLQVYPSIQDTGNFGQLSLDDSHAGESTESSWVTGGMTASDLADLKSANLVPLSAHTGGWDWVGDTGFKASLVSTVNGYSIDNYPTKTFILPLFTPYDSSTANYSAGTGNGSHYYYNIVQFVGIKIMPGGGNRQVLVQPAAVVNPYAVFDSSNFGILDTSGGSSTIVTTFSYPRLSQ
jgi:Flp pilus assembly protein TadG